MKGHTSKNIWAAKIGFNMIGVEVTRGRGTKTQSWIGRKNRLGSAGGGKMTMIKIHDILKEYFS